MAAEEAMENGELDETKDVKNDMRLMISKSDNAAAIRMIDRQGFEKIDQVLIDPKYEFLNRLNIRHIWFSVDLNTGIQKIGQGIRKFFGEGTDQLRPVVISLVWNIPGCLSDKEKILYQVLIFF